MATAARNRPPAAVRCGRTAALLHTRLLRTGLLRTGLLYTGLLRTGLLCVGLMCAGLLAACGSSEPAATGSGGASVMMRDHPQLGKILTDASGDTLYFAEQEADGKIRCREGCLSIWTPMTTAADAQLPAGIPGLGTVRREDNGTSQLTYQGMPLYTFTLDKNAGDTTGDNAQDDFSGVHFVWHAVTVGGQPPGGGASQPMPTTSGDGYGY